MLLTLKSSTRLRLQLHTSGSETLCAKDLMRTNTVAIGVKTRLCGGADKRPV